MCVSDRKIFVCAKYDCVCMWVCAMQYIKPTDTGKVNREESNFTPI